MSQRATVGENKKPDRITEKPQHTGGCRQDGQTWGTPKMMAAKQNARPTSTSSTAIKRAQLNASASEALSEGRELYDILGN